MQMIVSIFIACIHLILKLYFGVKSIVCEANEQSHEILHSTSKVLNSHQKDG